MAFFAIAIRSPALRNATMSCCCRMPFHNFVQQVELCANLPISISHSFATVSAQQNKFLGLSFDGPNNILDLTHHPTKAHLGDKKGLAEMEGRPTQELIESTRKIRECKGHGDWATALSILHSIQNPGYYQYSTALDVCTHNLLYPEAWKLWKMMPSTAHAPSRVIAYNMMIKMCRKLKRLRAAQELFFEMQQEGLEPSIITHCEMIQAHAMVGSWQEAMELLAQLRKTLIWVDATIKSKQIAMNGALSACGRTGKYDEARMLIQIMHDEGIPLQHNHFNSLLVACAHNHDAVKGDAVFVEMKMAGFEPRAEDYTMRITCSHDDQQTCETLFQEMCNKGVHPNRLTFESVARAALFAGNAVRAQELLNEARVRSRMPPTKISLQIEADAAAAIRGASPAAVHNNEHKLGNEAKLPDGWSTAICPSSGVPYYWQNANPTSTVTWVRP